MSRTATDTAVNALMSLTPDDRIVAISRCFKDTRICNLKGGRRKVSVYVRDSHPIVTPRPKKTESLEEAINKLMPNTRKAKSERKR